MTQARVIYDFNADGDAQISIAKGETITILGDVTPENWVLAKNSKGEEGYIPSGYYKESVVVAAVNAKKPGRPPPPIPTTTGGIAGTNTTSGGTTKESAGEAPSWANKNNNNTAVKTSSSSRKDSGLMDSNDTYNLFAYQMEWSAIALSFVNSLLAFFNATAQANWYWIIPPIFALTLIGVITLLIGFARERPTPLVRCVVFSLLMILMAVSWPFGWAGCGACAIAAGLNVVVARKGCKPLNSAITDDWRGQFMNGCDGWTPARMLFVAFVVIIDILSIAWGFINGYDEAEKITDDPDAAEVKPETYGVALGFGRVVTVNIAVLLLLACHGCITRQAQKFQRERGADTCLGRFFGYLGDDDGRRYAHRILAYSIVLFSYLHSVSMYYAYESSGVQRTFVDIFGIETVVTGIIVFIALSLVIGAANETILKQNPKLFMHGHSVPGVFMMFLLFFHGTGGTGPYYFMPVLGPFVLYGIDLALRWFAGDH